MPNIREKMIELLNSVQSVGACRMKGDFVEVVLCEKCRHWGEIPSGKICMRFGYCSKYSMHTAFDHFCLFGEG